MTTKTTSVPATMTIPAHRTSAAPMRLPARRTTNFCQALAILSESAMMTAATRKGGAKKRSRPTRAQAVTRKRIIGFMLIAPRAWSCRASWRASLPPDDAPSVQPVKRLLRCRRFGRSTRTEPLFRSAEVFFDRARHATRVWPSLRSPQSGLLPASSQPLRLFPRLWECGYYSFPEAHGGWETGRPCCSACCFFRLNDAPVAPLIDLRRSPPGGRVSKSSCRAFLRRHSQRPNSAFRFQGM